MRLSEPRIAPLEEDQWNEQARQVMQPFLEQGPVLNIFKTLAHHPDLMRRWLVFANHILGKSTLAARERELVILRIGYLCRAGYEWGQHVEIARRAGMSDDEIRSAKAGPESPGLPELDRWLLAATDELHRDAHVSDATWAGLAQHLTTQQLMDVVFTVGQYNLVSMALNSFGVQPDAGLPGWDV
ncbi:MAG: carboxymuconolactone decarboxylase family protein [Pseudomonadota bacterium]